MWFKYVMSPIVSCVSTHGSQLVLAVSLICEGFWPLGGGDLLGNVGH